MTLIYFVLILGITVTIHEFGHFIFAKKAGIYVYEFSIGMGPLLKQFRRQNDETVYSLRLLPIGGYVQMAGEEVEADKNIPQEKTLQAKTWSQRFMTIIAGVMMNFILAIVLLFIIALIQGAPNTKPIIGTVEENTPASLAGIEIGDTITKINGKKVSSTDRLLLEMQVSTGKPVELTLRKEDNTIKTISMKPLEIKEDGTTSYKYGFGIDNTYQQGFFNAIQYSFVKTASLVDQMIHIVGYLFTGKLSLNSLSGPVGIYNVVGETAKTGFINLVYLLAFISVNVGFINLLPIPAFDGGRLLFLIIEKIIKRPVDSKVENVIHSIFFLLLMILMVVITFNDIRRLF